MCSFLCYCPCDAEERQQNLPKLPRAKTPLEAARNGYKFYKHLQSEDGHWSGEYGGPMFLMPGLVIGSYVSGMTFKQEEKLEMIRYLLNHAHPEDGGWGMYVCKLVCP
jgi:lanosterol synthase